jgi:exonuclease III
VLAKSERTTQDKEDGIQELMNKLQLDVIFLSETFRASPENFSSQIEFLSRAGFCAIEMTNADRRRGIQFRVRSHFDPLLNPTLCFKDSHVEILSITIRGLMIIGVHAPDGKETGRTDVLLSILDRAVITGYGTIIVTGDPNAQACAL